MKSVLIFIIAIAVTSVAVSQTVSNARFEQDGTKVRIYYDLTDQAEISIYLSSDGGRTFEPSPITYVSGAVGKDVPSGKGNCAVWDALAERKSVDGDRFCFKIKAQPNNQLTAEQCYQMGNDYYDGKNGKTKDYAEAVRWFRKAAEQGHADGQSILGYMYATGQVVPQDYAEALKWYRKAAEQGYAKGQYNLGVMYEHVSQDYAEAVRWYIKAAEQGYADAQFNLGIMHANGRGVKQDHTKAMRWFRKAAEQGYANAQDALGIMYVLGQGVSHNYAEAVRWFRKAAEQGYATSQYNLGYMYENGKGVSQDYAEALRWYIKAATQGNSSAKERLEALNKQ